MNTISAKLAFLIVCISGLQTLSYGQQLQQSVSVPPCNVTVGLTASGSTASFDNRMLGCSVWALNYTSQGFTGVTVTVESASDNGGVPGVWTAFSGTVNIGSNPQTATTQGLVQLSGFNPWIRVTLSGTTGVGTVRGTLYGYKLSADAPSATPAPVGTPDLYITGAAAQSAAGNNIMLDTAGTGSIDTMATINSYRSLQVQIVASAGITSGAVIFEYSNNNITFFPLQMYEATSSTTLNASTVHNTPTTVTASTNRTFLGKVMGRFIRCRISTVFAGGTVQAFSRLSVTDYVPWITALAGSQTLATVTSVGTVTTVTTVSAVTSAGLANAAVTDIASAAITSTQTSSAIATTNIQSAAFAVSVTATSGTPTLDIVIQCSFNTTTWQDIYQFERITATTTLISPTIDIPCQQIRYVRTVAGGSPSITMSLVRQSKQINGYRHVSYFDRTIAPATLNSATPAFWIEGTKFITAIVSSAAATTPASFIVDLSPDGTNWAAVGTAVASVANTTTIVLNTTGVAKFARIRVSVAGSAQTLNYVHLRAQQ